MIHYPDVLRKNALHTDALQFPNVDHTKSKLGHTATPCSLGLSANSQQYFFSQNKPATSNQPEVLFSQNKPAPAIRHQPNEQAVSFFRSGDQQ
jgi:hypothetical protein